MGGKRKRVEIENGHDGVYPLHREALTRSCSTNNRTAVFKDNVVEHKELVEIRRLDSLTLDYFPPDERGNLLLKIDTQGYDLEVLRGASRWLPRVALVMLELSVKPIYDEMPHWLQAIEEVTKHGFSLLDLLPVTRDADMTVIEYDALFLRNERV